MNLGIHSVLGLFLPLLLAPGNLAGSPVYESGTVGTDISYPNCKVELPKFTFGVVGVGGGRSYTENGCFLKQALSFPQNRSLYVNTGWPDRSDKIDPTSPKRCAATDKICLAYNYGYNAGAVAYYRAAQDWIRSDTWWLDVETMNSWSVDTEQNRASIQGQYDALKARGVTTVGVYSTTYQWNKITGKWKNGWPTWGATVVTSADQARRFCMDSHFTGGRSMLIQYRPKSSPVSYDYAC